MSQFKSLVSSNVVKPLVGGAIAFAADTYILKNTDMKSALMFGGVVAGSFFMASTVGLMVEPLLPTSTSFSLSKTLESRIIEITVASGSAYAINTYLLKNEFNKQNYMYKLAIIVGADLVSETVEEMIDRM